MRCFICHGISWKPFCKKCRIEFLRPSISKRTLDSLDVYSFFGYQDLKELLLTKYTLVGHRIYRGLGEEIFRPFIVNFAKNIDGDIYIIGVDERINRSGYSHVALLTRSLSYKNIKILHSKLMATNSVNYSGKNLRFRLENPRNFEYSGKKNLDAILVDDIITTGTTLKEARRVLTNCGINLLFALTLADAKG